MTKQVFYLWLEGPDTGYGPSNSTEVKITFEDDCIWDEEQIQDIKEKLAEFYDVRVTGILTEEEIKLIQ